MLNADCLRRVFQARPGEPPRVGGVILYGDFTCGLRLKHAFDEVFREVFSRVGWAARYHLSLWHFPMLRVRAICGMAAEDAANTVVFGVAAPGEGNLGPEVAFLIQEWLAHRDGEPRALVLADYGDDPIALRSSPAGAYLRAAARRTGMIFLVHPLGPRPVSSLGDTEERANQSAIRVLPITALGHGNAGAGTAASIRESTL